MPRWLSLLENEVQIFALSFMVLVYAARVVWLFRFGLAADHSRPAGNPYSGILPALTSIFRPWAMESTRKKWWQWLEFGVFHVAVAVMIGLSFVIPYAPRLLTPAVAALCIATQIGGLVACTLRLYNRLADPVVKTLSAPEDIFALLWVDVLFVACTLALLNYTVALGIYFALVALIIMYVPFSKISHYLYFPFARIFFGTSFARRGNITQ